MSPAPRSIASVDFHELLDRELRRRKQNNPRYSLRAFARQLDIDHSTLSQILRRRRRLTTRVLRRLGAALQVPQADIDSASTRANADAVAAVVRDPSFRPDCRWIASKLAMRLDDVQIALHDVLRTGRVVIRSARQWEAMNG
jgi:transcriptional regulator with XRE-family HTH domain